MKQVNGNSNMTIGQLEIASNVDAQTIRYYERQGLLAEPERTESNYRVYNNDAIERLAFIKRAKEIGFSLNDIKVLLGMADGRIRRCDDVREFAETRLAKIRSQIKHLKSMEIILADLVGQCAVFKTLKNCPILFKAVKK